MRDLIDREAALNCFHSWVDQYGDVHTPDEIPEYQAIEALPSAQPETHDKRTEKHACDLISRQAAIETVMECYDNDELFEVYEDKLRELPPAQPAIVPCNYVKACNVATMDKLTSAVLYLDVLEELKKHGYVLVDMREVTE